MKTLESVFFVVTFFLLILSILSIEGKLTQQKAKPLGLPKKGNKVSLGNFKNILKSTGLSSERDKTFTVNGKPRKGGAITKTQTGGVPCGGPNSGLFYDRCGVCGGENKCVDCFNVTFGRAKLDRCRICDGSNECVGCDNKTYIDNPEDMPQFDICEECGGDGTSCLDCDGVPNGGKVRDACGNCGGDGSECCGLHGECSGHGSCDSTLKGCRCDLGWTGVTCQARQNLCKVNGEEQECNGRGLCNQDTGICDCENDWFGDQCQLKTCSGHGLYNPDIKACICRVGYSGEDCSVCSSPPKGMAYVCMQKFEYKLPEEKYAFEGNKVNKPQQTIDFQSSGEWGERIPDNIKDVKSLSKTALESIIQPVIQRKTTPELRFLRIAVPEKDVAIHIMGMSVLSNSIPGIIILPGTQINGTTYGCNCRKATPYDEGDIYDVVKYTKTPANSETNADKLESSNGKKNKKKDGEEKSIEQAEQDAYNKIWGSQKSKEGEGDNGDKKEDPGYNSLTIIKQRDRQDKLDKPIFSEDERQRYGAYTDDIQLISQGRIFSRFIEPRAPVNLAQAQGYLTELLTFFGQDVDATTDDATVIGAAVNSVKSGQDADNAVTAVIIIAGALGGSLLTMGVTACIFITSRYYDEE